MSKKLFVGSLDWATTEADLSDLFSEYGEVLEAIIIKDELKRSKGFGFVTMADEEGADAAISNLHEKQVGKRTIVVTEARPQEARPPRKDFGDRPPRRY